MLQFHLLYINISIITITVVRYIYIFNYFETSFFFHYLEIFLHKYVSDFLLMKGLEIYI